MIKDCRMKSDDFEMVKVIGRGAFGEVQLVSTFTFSYCNNMLLPQSCCRVPDLLLIVTPPVNCTAMTSGYMVL